MSQKASRKLRVSTEEKEKKQTDSSAKDVKKKMVANTEKEKHTIEKSTEKVEKPAEKADNSAEKTEKAAEKKTDKVEKKPEPEKKEQEKENDSNKDDIAAKSEKSEAKSSKPKHNGNARVNGNATNGDHNGTVSATPESEDDDEDDDGEGDEMFPELTYDDTSDPEFEPDTPHGRSITRRSQSKDSKVLKLKEDVASTDRKLRSADSPKPESKKQQESKQESAKKESQDKPQETSKKSQETQPKKEDSVKKSTDSTKKVSPKKQEKESPKKLENESLKNQEKETKDKKESDEENADEPIAEIMEIDDEEEPRKTDTNFSKSRVKVSPYRRSMRADHTASSTMANYTGNNTTMEMDITESSFSSTTDVSLDDSSYLSSLRNIRGRRSYKQLKEMTLRHVTEKQHRPNTSASATSELPSRPTGTVVGRKRKPDGELEVGIDVVAHEAGKRMRLFDRLAQSLRTTTLPALPTLPARRNAEIVGINTDLPLTVPVASTDTFDPETLKATSTPTPAMNPAPIPVSPIESDKDNKRCIVM